MGSLVPDGEVEEPLIIEAACKELIDISIINDFLHLQLVAIREVEGHRHVGLPHAALHVVHGKGVGAGGQVFDGKRVFLVVICIIIIYVFNALLKL